MEIDHNLSWWNLFFLLLLMSPSDCQFQICSEFKSPTTIWSIGTSVGSIQIPLPPGTERLYRSNQLCEWNIITSIPGNGIRLDVKRSDLQGRSINGECNNDYVDIFDYVKGDIVFMDRFCGREIGKSYLTSGNKMTIQFHSDNYWEFTGFEVMFQSVPAGPSKDQQEEGNKRTLDMVIGIPIGILTLIVMVLVTIFIIRYCKRKKAARPPPTTSCTQNPSALRHGLPGGCHPSGTSTSSGPPSYYQDFRAESNDDFFLRNVPLNVVMSGSSQEGSRNDYGVTPPPAYDSLDFGSSEVEHNRMPLTPPPYEMIFKQNIGPSSG